MFYKNHPSRVVFVFVVYSSCMMEMKKKYWVSGGVGVLLVTALIWFLAPAKTQAPSVTPIASSTVPVATVPVAPKATSTPVVFTTFPINSADNLTSWNFTGAYSGNPSLIAQATADSEHLKSLIAAGGSPDYDTYDLYLGIGNDASLVGDGKTAYQNYNKAIAIHPKKGLGYTNMGHLMEQLGAYHTAADAYARAVAVEPAMLEYHLERLTFLKTHFGTNNAMMLAAFTDSSNQFGDVAQVLTIEAQWLTDQERYADAIAAWQRVELLSFGRATSTIDAEIARLQAKL